MLSTLMGLNTITRHPDHRGLFSVREINQAVSPEPGLCISLGRVSIQRTIIQSTVAVDEPLEERRVNPMEDLEVTQNVSFALPEIATK